MPEASLATGLVYVYPRARKALFAASFCQASNEHLLIKPVKAWQANGEQVLVEQARALDGF